MCVHATPAEHIRQGVCEIFLTAAFARSAQRARREDRMAFMVEKMLPSQWEEVRAIYLEGLATGDATFETEAPAWERWDASHYTCCRLVALEGARVAGWAALSPVSTRAAYAGVAEVSVYVASSFRGRGVGRALLSSLVVESEANGVWTLQASIFPENVASLELHRACGFREIGRRERIAQRDGRWRDTILLERRSRIVGVD
jgi:L-amino acid N-acyltransferase YncA